MDISVKFENEDEKLLETALRVTKLDPEELFKRMLRSLTIISSVRGEIYLQSMVHVEEEEPPDPTNQEIDQMADELDLEFLDNIAQHFAERRQTDRGEKTRIFAIVHTHLQEAAALFDRHVVRAK